MKLIHRFGYYLGGFAIGLVFLAFFLSGKRTSCSYGPNARVLKNISIKKRVYSDSIRLAIVQKHIDTMVIRLILTHGRVNFSKSNTRLDSCKVYLIEKTIESKNYKLSIRNCDSIAYYDTLLVN